MGALEGCLGWFLLKQLIWEFEINEFFFFIKNYLDFLPLQTDIVYGGICYQKNRPEKKQMLRWKYGNKKEVDETEVKVPEENNYFKLLLKGFFLNFINIGVLAGWLGIMVVVGPSLDMNPRSIFWYFAVVILGYAVTDLGKILLAKQLRDKMTPLVIYRIKRGMGVLLIVFGAVLMLKGFIPNDKIDELIH